MLTPAAETLVKMLETVPEPMQRQVVERLCEQLEDIREELRWDEKFEKTRDKLAAVARRVEDEIAAGLATPFDPDEL